MSLRSWPHELLGELSSLPTGSLAAHPQPDVRRAMLQHDALCFAGDEEVHDRDVTRVTSSRSSTSRGPCLRTWAWSSSRYSALMRPMSRRASCPCRRTPFRSSGSLAGLRTMFRRKGSKHRAMAKLVPRQAVGFQRWMPMDQQLPNRSAGLRGKLARECGDLSLVEHMRAARDAPSDGSSSR